jgi:hypothetical protein
VLCFKEKDACSIIPCEQKHSSIPLVKEHSQIDLEVVIIEDPSLHKICDIWLAKSMNFWTLF